MRSIKWCHFQWPRTNSNPVFKVTPFFGAKYLTNGYRYGQSYYRPEQTHTHEIASYCPWRTSRINKSLPYFAAINLATLALTSPNHRLVIKAGSANGVKAKSTNSLQCHWIYGYFFVSWKPHSRLLALYFNYPGSVRVRKINHIFKWFHGKLNKITSNWNIIAS